MLKEFLTDWLNWAEAGGEDESIFFRRHGLCQNAIYYAVAHDMEALPDILSEVFETAYPFGFPNYKERRRDGTQHLDPARLAWVRNYLKLLED